MGFLFSKIINRQYLILLPNVQPIRLQNLRWEPLSEREFRQIKIYSIRIATNKTEIDDKFQFWYTFAYCTPIFFIFSLSILELVERQLSEQPSEPPAEKILAEEEKEACKSESWQLNGYREAETNAATDEKDDQISMDDGEMAAIQLNDLKRNAVQPKKSRPFEVKVVNDQFVEKFKWLHHC